MKLETFFEKFDLFAEAPDAVARMREVVLELAVQGRLVSQFISDEPAGALAAAIATDRAAFVKKRKLTRQRVFASVEADQCSFMIPSGWIWTRLGNLCRVQAGFAFASASFVQGGSGVPMIRIRDITKDHTQVNYVGEYREEFLVEAGDYLVGMDGNFTVAKWRGPRALLNQRVSRLQWYSQRLEPSFFAIALQHRLVDLQGTKAYTTVDHLSSGQIENAVVPLPPLAEQKRIVAKVEELMALCDQLEAQQQERQTRHAALVQASLARFTQDPTPANLQFLFHPSYTVSPADLRKTILTLAVQGKLVPQDLDDELASPCPKNECPFDLPANWQWKCLGNLGACRTGKTPPTNDPTNYGLGFSFIGPGQIAHNGNLTPSEKTITQTGLSNSTEAKVNDILMVCIGGSIGKTAICRETLAFNQQINSIRLKDDIPEFIYLALTSSYFQEQVIDRASGSATPIINKGKWEKIPIPLPPLAEQRRIVAKVDELMALVDELETQLVASRTVAQNLLAALVRELTTTP